MANGEYSLEGLSLQEHKAALAAVKLVRGKEITNAYMEGFRDGFEQRANLHAGRIMSSDGECWVNSHAYKLQTNKEDL